ncbi:hypothetical protein DSECCO2_317340 [anaerobic digester metagenome]
MVNGRPLGDGIVWTGFDLEHDALVDDLAKVRILALIYIAVVNLQRFFQGFGCHGNGLILVLVSVDLCDQIFQGVRLENPFCLDSGFELCRSDKPSLVDDLLSEDGEGREASAVLCRSGAYIAAFPFVDVALSVHIHIDNT